MLHYRGPHQRVHIPLPNGREAEVAKGKDIDLSEYDLTAEQRNEVEKGLLAQEDSWSEATPASPPKPSKSNDDKEG